MAFQLLIRSYYFHQIHLCLSKIPAGPRNISLHDLHVGPFGCAQRRHAGLNDWDSRLKLTYTEAWKPLLFWKRKLRGKSLMDLHKTKEEKKKQEIIDAQAIMHHNCYNYRWKKKGTASLFWHELPHMFLYPHKTFFTPTEVTALYTPWVRQPSPTKHHCHTVTYHDTRYLRPNSFLNH